MKWFVLCVIGAVTFDEILLHLSGVPVLLMMPVALVVGVIAGSLAIHLNEWDRHR